MQYNCQEILFFDSFLKVSLLKKKFILRHPTGGLIIKDEQPTPSIHRLLPRLWRHVTLRRRVQLGLLFLLMILASAAELVSIGSVLPFLGVLTSPEKIFNHVLTQQLINLINLTKPEQLLAPLTILFGLAAMVSGSTRLLLSWAQTRLSYAIGADFSISIYRRTLYQPYAVHLSRNSSEVITGVTTKADGIVHHTLVPILVIISSGVMMATVLLALLVVHPAVTFAAIGGFGGVYAIAIISTRRRMLENSRLISTQQPLLIKVLQEALGGIRDVLIDGTQNVFCDIYRDADRQLRHAQSKIAIISVSPRYIVEALGMAMISAMAYLLATRTGAWDSAIPIIGTLALAAQRMLPLLQQAYAGWSTIRGGHSGLSDALKLLDQPMPSYACESQASLLPFEHEITFDRVGFKYSEDQPWVIQGLNLKISKHSRVGFIGTTGSGKSTLLDIAMGLLSPSEGLLKVDDNVITSINCRAWQRHIAHVPQAIFLSDSSVLENIAFGVPYDQIDFDKVREAAKKAQIDSTIESWPNRYSTLVGERGVRLSGGQRQRIGIARALYKKADVIVFDEATSALDGETEHAVMESIKELSGDLTILIVAHRLTTLRYCTQVVELERGRINRIGSYQSIVEDGDKLGGWVSPVDPEAPAIRKEGGTHESEPP